MKKMLKYCIISLILVILFNISTKVIKAEDNILKYAKSGILIEVETGKVLYEKNAHIRYEPASMTKMMTMKLVLDAISSKRISMEDELTTSEYASKMGGSQIFLSPGEKMKVEDLFKSMVIASANDAAVCLAEGISGSDKFFVEQMNNEVKKLGLNNTNFSNVTGLPTNNHYSSSYDMAMIARNLILEYEDKVIPYTSCYEDYVRKNSDNPFWLVNTNKLIKHIDGIDGLKTGWTEAAGYCLTCTKKENGMRLISVVMNVDSVIHRTEDTLALLNYGFANYNLTPIMKKGEVVSIENNLLLTPNKYNIVTDSDIVVLKGKNEKLKDIRYEIEINKEKIKNEYYKNIGTMKVYEGNELIQEVKLNLEEIPKKANFFQILIIILKYIF